MKKRTSKVTEQTQILKAWLKFTPKMPSGVSCEMMVIAAEAFISGYRAAIRAKGAK